MKTHIPFSDLESLRRLAVSESGFVFDPVKGNSYTVNETGLALLRLMQQGLDTDAITKELCARYELADHDAAREVLDFAAHLAAAMK